MDNSTGGFVALLVGLPYGMLQIPREWLHQTKRVELKLRDLGCSNEALDTLSKLYKNYMEAVLEQVVMNRLMSSMLGEQNRYIPQFNHPVIERIYPETNEILPLELMSFKQASVDCNLKYIKLVLGRDFGYSTQDLIQEIFLVGGDSMLVSRVRSIQMLRECDILGEDFKFILPSLGPLHTLMNMIKMTMKLFLGP